MVYGTGSGSLPVFFFYLIQKSSRLIEGCLCLSVILCLGRSTDRAGLSAGATFDAGIRVDFELAVAFADGGNGAFGSAGTAADAFIGNFVSHWNTSS